MFTNKISFCLFSSFNKVSATSYRTSKFFSSCSSNVVKLKRPNKFDIVTSDYVSKIHCRNFSLQSAENFLQSVSSSEASKLVKNILVEVHDFSGLPWSFTIIGASIVMKLFTSLPCGIYQRYLTSKIELLKSELDGIAKVVKGNLLANAKKGKWTENKFKLEFRNEMKRHWKDLIIKNNCHPFKIVILFFVQLPAWLLLTITIRAFATDASNGTSEHPVAALQFQAGGPPWSKNLTLPDPYYVLPAVNFISILFCSELSFLSEALPKVTEGKAKIFIRKVGKILSRTFAVVFLIISSASPSGLSLFWASSSVFALGQTLLLMSPKVRRLCGIPKTPVESDKPYSRVWSNFLDNCRKVLFWKK